ncbi:MBL fold metallo-hydrolase [Halobacillus litoralis]|uniref:MBL fold metallo-hydrolase n=1 Tax=Halobacillus litoralis TaxID=45668 RepID=A0A845E535_9BACI|nr:MBL fold metallo-hydrolase [Halobacillus litoralis]MYL49942.1 MBL fold metallo-hydrolase [Halobacillus litoralis]
MEKYICQTCGVQYSESEEVPDRCEICSEERQYVSPEGQTWTTHEDLVQTKRYQNIIREEEKGLYSITTTPKLGIGQTAYLIQKDGLNVLWDCITYLDQETVDVIRDLGGIDAIAISHPHYYSRMTDWAETFDAPVYLHEDDEEWVMEESSALHFWNGESMKLSENLSLHRLGGHFKGGAVLHIEKGAEGLLMTGDIIQVVTDNQWVSFMYSYPNLIPLPAAKVAEIAEKVNGLAFERIYNAFHNIVKTRADEVVRDSAERYIRAIQGTLFTT